MRKIKTNGKATKSTREARDFVRCTARAAWQLGISADFAKEHRPSGVTAAAWRAAIRGALNEMRAADRRKPLRGDDLANNPDKV